MPYRKRYRIGVDVGGTNTDCAILELDKDNTPTTGSVIAWEKTVTTEDVTVGIAKVLKSVLDKVGNHHGIHPDQIVGISIGTTHFINAIIEADARRLAKVAVLRLGAPYTSQCPPFTDFPPSLRNLMEGHYALLDGGLQIDGKPIRPINEDQIKRECDIIRKKGIRNVVVVGVFSPLAEEGTQEHYVRDVIEGYLGKGSVNIVCSREVGPVGLLERENAAILDCSMLSFARRTIKSYYAVLSALQLKSKLYLTQLDGTLLSARLAASHPIRTFANGPTNSMRGAAFLSALDIKESRESVVVVDIGGTTTDVGVLLPSGLPRKAAAYTSIGGVRTNFSMPDILSIGLGGGSRIRFNDDGRCSVGPDSVGARISSDSIAFGGSTLTVTDAAIMSGRRLDDSPSLNTNVGDIISKGQLLSIQMEINRLLESTIDRMKTVPEDCTVIVVGGGSIILDTDRNEKTALKGVKRIIKPPHFAVANAVGAAIARVSGEVDKVVMLIGKNYDEIIEMCKLEAIEEAVKRGAKKESVEIAEVAVVQLPYVSNEVTRIAIKAVGDLADDLDGKDDWNIEFEELGIKNGENPKENLVETSVPPAPEVATKTDFEHYRPYVTASGEWIASETDLAFLSEGCAVLGCGGGGAPYPAYLAVRRILQSGGKVRIVDESYFSEDQAKGLIIPCGFMGSPSVSFERIPAGTELSSACTALLKACGFQREQVVAVLSDEIGGKNGIEPMRLASSMHLDIPYLDGDLMGRAYPRMNQVITCAFSKHGLMPAAGADGVGNSVVVPSTTTDAMVETLLRAVCTELGSALGVAMAPLTVKEFREWGLNRSTSLAWWIGRAIYISRQRSAPNDIPRAILQVQDGQVLFKGKIIDVKREVRGGFTWGTLKVVQLRQDELDYAQRSRDPAADLEEAHLIIPFQNENLAASLVDSQGQSKVLCTVPDLIIVLDSQNGSSIGTQDYRYGLRVTIIGMVGNPRWQTPEGLELGGPGAFGIDSAYHPIGKYKEVESVIQHYGNYNN